MSYAERLIAAWRGRSRRGVADVWAGDTVVIGGRTYFKTPKGRLVPAQGGGAQSWEELVESITVDGTQISNTTTETIICPDFNIPAYWWSPGRTIRIAAAGVVSNVVTTPGTLTMRVRLGGVSGTTLLRTADLSFDDVAYTNALWSMDATIVCRTIGSTGTFMSSGTFRLATQRASAELANNTTLFSALAALMGSAGTPSASGNAAVTVSTVVANLLSITAAFSLSTSPTNLTCQQRLVEIMN